MTPEELLERIKTQLRSRSDDAFRRGVNQFFKQPVNAWGVRSSDLAPIVRDSWREVKSWPIPARNRLCNELWKSGRLEEGALVCHLYRHFSRQCGACEFHLFEKWIDRYVTNWAHCDGVSSWLLAACIANEPALMPALLPWTSSPNRWKRRAAAVSLLQEAKSGGGTEFIFEVAGCLIEDPDDMVRKGVGWLLKETYPEKPAETVRFLRAWRNRASSLLLRYASEKMNPAHRALFVSPRTGSGP